MPGVNQHHVLFDRSAWRSSDVRRDLRETRGLIVPLRLDAHQELHKNVSMVPLLDWRTAYKVRRDFEAEPGQYVQNLGALCLNIEEQLRHPRTSDLERACGELTVQAIQEQIPFIQDGMVRGRGGLYIAV